MICDIYIFLVQMLLSGASKSGYFSFMRREKRNVEMTGCIVRIHQSHIKIQIGTQSSVTFCAFCESRCLILESLAGLNHQQSQSLFPVSNLMVAIPAELSRVDTAHTTHTFVPSDEWLTSQSHAGN